ncbi:hypothetical protein NUU61_009127 [Penicillium alfredii]|uniref:Uncharacterized protein n=1 Tax=Penicillium alfredii TaxID=1506179 RepID=A0A9W9EMG1_9EURO|nr:uncharacterized protein NUU61_009127 [Penicillium alfredii]KAJ5084548.1 hypothetical protein NUU61_009127 [Penicillium alfredii]
MAEDLESRPVEDDHPQMTSTAEVERLRHQRPRQTTKYFELENVEHPLPNIGFAMLEDLDEHVGLDTQTI